MTVQDSTVVSEKHEKINSVYMYSNDFLSTIWLCIQHYGLIIHKCIWLLIHIHSLHVSDSKGAVTIYALNMYEE